MTCQYQREEKEKVVVETSIKDAGFFSCSDVHNIPVYYQNWIPSRIEQTKVSIYCNLLEYELRKQGREYEKQLCTFGEGGDPSCPGYKEKAIS